MVVLHLKIKIVSCINYKNINFIFKQWQNYIDYNNDIDLQREIYPFFVL